MALEATKDTHQCVVQLQNTPKQVDNTVMSLTNLMAVKGTLLNEGRVIVKVSSQYCISKTIPSAIKLYERRIKMIETELNNDNKLVNDRNALLVKMQEIVKRWAEMEKIFNGKF